RLAGIPLSARAYKLGQTDEAGDWEPEAEPAGNTPWYARQWVLWTGAGLAATAAVLSNDDPDEKNQNNINNGAGNNNGSNAGIGCVDGQCVFSCHGDLTNPDPSTCGTDLGLVQRRIALPAREPDGLLVDAANGQMGDLIAR
ncbi:MAG: hypothetical protein HYZ32_02790, partial [Hydrocarboniphaga effusa]|nr:hypothetical protein [Hydrocarboniphaga effusa]